MKIIFRNERHEQEYEELCERMKYLDCYHRAMAYLITLDEVLRNHVMEIFDLKEDSIRSEGLDKAFQTDTSKQTTRLAFNLWNGFCYEAETNLISRYFTVDNIFNCNEYAQYYWQAIKIRFELYSI